MCKSLKLASFPPFYTPPHRLNRNITNSVDVSAPSLTCCRDLTIYRNLQKYLKFNIVALGVSIFSWIFCFCFIAGCVSTFWRYHPSHSASYLHFMFCDWFLVHLKSYNFLHDCYRWSSPPTVTFYIPKCCKLQDDSFYIAQWGRWRVFFCAHACNHVWPPTSRSSSMPSKKIMELSEDICLCRNCSKARSHNSR